ncbi:hypothetical protein [Paenibacillus flagellatus]|uniref:DUF4386 domain-containing protein n=1 Tax=Paenibacillus flagellatus TaxID=2211139 RepID=A0A2V5K1N8_9BACL|nr:hypothetical protein [Paenibacillus flagellatus]PYI52532.1 hypothetical protein DLM86_20365 [Paenibacillus flagellatus]
MIIPKGYLTFGGWALMLGGAMGAVGQLVHAPDVPDSVEHIPHFLDMAVNVHVLLAWASAFVLMGLPAIFLRQAQGLKWWGWLALPLLFIALMFEIFHGPVQILAYPILFGSIDSPAALQAVSDQINHLSVDRYPAQLLVLVPIVPFLFAGMVLLGIATLTSRTIHKAPGVALLVVFALLVIGRFVPIRFFELAFSYVHLAFAAYGAAIVFGRGRIAAADSPEAAAPSA